MIIVKQNLKQFKNKLFAAVMTSQNRIFCFCYIFNCWTTLISCGNSREQGFGITGGNCANSTEGCGRVPATPPPTTPPPPTAPTVNGSVQALECTSGETNDTNCLNGGTCFVFVLEGDRTTTCHCPLEYEGLRCQKLNIDVIVPPGSREPHPIAKAGIAASVVVVIIIVIVFTAVFIVYRRRKKREEEEKKHKPAGVNGSLLPENAHQPPNPNMQYAKNGGSNHMNMNFEEKKPLHHYQITSV